MILIKNGLIEIEHEASHNIMSVKWANELSVESSAFFQTIITLFTLIKDKKATHLIVDSGLPAGGALTEEVIHYIIHHIPNIPLKKIAILESPDFHWDNNLYQLIKLLITNYQLPIIVNIVKNRAAARDFFLPSFWLKTQKKKIY